MTPSTAHTLLLERWRDIWLLTTTAATIEWDEETTMPRQGAEHRGQQGALLAGLHHERLTSPELGELAALASTSTNPRERAQGQQALRLHQRAVRLPRTLVEEQKRVSALAQRAWLEAREARSYSVWEPWLARTVGLKRDEAQALLTTGQEPWEPLLEEFEPGATVASVVPLLEQLGRDLVPLVQQATSSAKRPDPALLSRSFDVDAQRLLGQMVAVALGFDLERGGLALTTHPFCATLGDDDVRIALRYAADNFSDGFFATIHEVGHALYEQGVPRDLVGTPAGELRSLALHESQSRLWENMVGRSVPFWTHWFPTLQRLFPDVVGDVPFDTFTGAINAVTPGPIRVGADEVTYSLHILVRVELERALINGTLEARELPEAWNAAYRRHLGITPTDDIDGILQDGHWSAGLFGYFPTYTLGNLYAAQLWSAARAALPTLDDDLARGHSASLRGWLQTRVYAPASTLPAARVVEQATGQALSTAPFLAHLKARLAQHGMG